MLVEVIVWFGAEQATQSRPVHWCIYVSGAGSGEVKTKRMCDTNFVRAGDDFRCIEGYAKSADHYGI